MEVMLHNTEVYFDVCVALMDDDLREELAQELPPCTEQEFLDAYIERHAKKFGGEEFEI